MNDDGSLKLKARIAPHGNEDDLKRVLNKDCSTCPPTGRRILEYIASLHGWRVYKADVSAAFFQTGKAERDFYFRPPRESPTKTTHIWILLTASYGLVNSNAKWQNQSDELLLDYGLDQSRYVAQLFFKREAGKLVLVVAKIVNELKVSGTGNRAKAFLDVFDSRFKLVTINRGPGKLPFFYINTVQHEDFTGATDADENIESVSEYPIK